MINLLELFFYVISLYNYFSIWSQSWKYVTFKKNIHSYIEKEGV
jgi:hypothetical protein